MQAMKYVGWTSLSVESKWPYSATYTASQGNCPTLIQSPTSGKAVQLSANPMVLTQTFSISRLIAAVKQAPVVIAMKCDATFVSYRGGVYYPTTCSGPVNHAMLLVGYGADAATGARFWLGKNSWGRSWGEDGYFRVILRDSDDGSYGPCNLYIESWQFNPLNSFISSNLVSPYK